MYGKSTRWTKLIANDNTYMVGQWMNIYFVDFFSIHQWLLFVTKVVCNLSNLTKGNIVTNFIPNKKQVGKLVVKNLISSNV